MFRVSAFAMMISMRGAMFYIKEQARENNESTWRCVQECATAFTENDMLIIIHADDVEIKTTINMR